MVGLKPGCVRERAAAMLALAVAAGIALTACTQAARPPATTGAPASPASPASPPEADPPPQQAEKIWSIGEDAFDDDANLIATSNRSKPFAWDGITGAEGEKVTVSIGGHELPFTNKATAPRFENDLSGAEWEVFAEVSAGSIVLVLTAPDQTEALDYVESVRITNRGSGYTAPPAVTFGAAPASGATAAGTAAGPGQVASVRVTTAGSGYPSAPAVTFAAAPSGGTTAAAAAVAIGQVASVSITNGGTGYTPTATVAFGTAPAGGVTAAGTVFGPDRVESVTITEAGSGWTATPRIIFSAPQRPGGSRPSIVTVFLDGDKVDRVGFYWNDNYRGSGYTSAPTVTFAPNAGGDPDGGSSGVAVLREKIDGVTITSGGSGYTSAPAVYFSPPPSGTTAIGTAVMNYDVEDVTITNPGSGYTSAPTVTFAAAPSGGSATTAVGTATLRTEVTSVAITNGGSGYTSAPTVTFAAPSGGTTATGVAVLAESGNDQYQNLFWARDTLSGKQLRVRVGEE